MILVLGMGLVLDGPHDAVQDLRGALHALHGVLDELRHEHGVGPDGTLLLAMLAVLVVLLGGRVHEVAHDRLAEEALEAVPVLPEDVEDLRVDQTSYPYALSDVLIDFRGDFVDEGSGVEAAASEQPSMGGRVETAGRVAREERIESVS